MNAPLDDSCPNILIFLSFSGVIYCGPACRKEANDVYHKYECGITDVIHKAQIGGWALAYRAITTHPFEYFLENKDKILNSNELLGSKDHNEEVSFP